jgi:hydrogenase nickel incorporation protein HypA/HybF
MHELPVTQSILDVALEAGGKAHAGRITAIELVVGDLASIVDDSVQFYFEILSKGTIAEGAVLRFRREPAIATCGSCGHTFNASPPLLPVCPRCGSIQLSVTGGRSFYVESIDVDEPPGGS